MSINLEEDKCTFAFNLPRRHEKVIFDFYDKQCLLRNYQNYLQFIFEYDNTTNSIDYILNTNQIFIHQQLK